MNNYERIDFNLNTLLFLKKAIVGIRFLSKEDDYKHSKGQPLLHKLPYCVMVKSACCGHLIKATKENFGCHAAARALGFIPPEDSFLDGTTGFNFGIYHNKHIAAECCENISLKRRADFGIEIGPLYKFKQSPNVVIFITTPYYAMRLLQAHTYHYENHNSFKMGGLQALCSESTAYPYLTGNFNISMLCAGMRYVANWKEDELAVSIPYYKLEKICDGLKNTVNPLERNEKKQLILEKINKTDSIAINIEFGKNYDTGLYSFGRSGKR